ncbi:hypothetical protein [Actinocrispum wychmicini]|uniref:Secreted protein n=1 Tax=Actinocrispum wychmicini TaxID=1213861 RepID=A0A4V2S841_9PSEU|nr:hypothetical protein [Actinocrispum wychmicini]TCO62100.1 hypothetical protein EV192_102237 [Actinocrispum wychmicini]
MIVRLSRRALASGVVRIVAVAGAALASTEAAAATTTSCTSGFSPWTLTSVNLPGPNTNCNSTSLSAVNCTITR